MVSTRNEKWVGPKSKRWIYVYFIIYTSNSWNLDWNNSFCTPFSERYKLQESNVDSVDNLDCKCFNVFSDIRSKRIFKNEIRCINAMAHEGLCVCWNILNLYIHLYWKTVEQQFIPALALASTVVANFRKPL